MICDPTIDDPAHVPLPSRCPPGQNGTLHLWATDAFLEEQRGVLIKLSATGDFQPRIRLFWVYIWAVADGHRITNFPHTRFPIYKFFPLTPNHRFYIVLRPEDVTGRCGTPSNTASIDIYGLTYASTDAIVVRNIEYRCPPPVPPLLTSRSPDAVFPPKLRLELNPTTSQDNRDICLLWDVTEAPQMDIKCIYVFCCMETAEEYWRFPFWRIIRRRRYTSLPAFVEVKVVRGNKVYFSATAEDVDGKFGPFSDPVEFDPF